MPEFFGPFELPDEIAQTIKDRYIRDQMEMESIRLDIERLFVELTPEHLHTLRIILGGLKNDRDGQLAAYYEGITSQTMVLKHGLCGGCGQKHDTPEDFALAHGTQEEQKDSEQEVAAPPLVMPSSDGTQSLFSVYVDKSKDLKGQTGMIPIEILERMEKYDLDDLRDEDTNAILGFKCNNCGITYQSIEDRELKRPGPGGCSGCVEKTKFG